MRNGNGELKPVPPQPGMPLPEGVPEEAQAGIVEEPEDAIMAAGAAFNEPRIFVSAPHYEWHQVVHVQGQDEEARQRIVGLEQLVHRFGCRTEAREEELRQRLDQVGGAA